MSVIYSFSSSLYPRHFRLFFSPPLFFLNRNFPPFGYITARHLIDLFRAVRKNNKKAIVSICYCIHTVSIWLACLDQHGQIIAGADPERGPSRTEQAAAMHDVASSVQVAAHDPNNVIVHYWSVSLVGSGLKNLLFQLSDLPQRTGMWTIRATAGGLTAAQSFRLIRAVPQHQSEPDANATEAEEKAIDPSPMIESHFVELDFSPRTASLIQQGSPFAGEVTYIFRASPRHFLRICR